MARVTDLDFEGYVRTRRDQHGGALGGDSHAYAYTWDRQTREAFERAKAVELAVAAAVRIFKNVGKAELLGHSVKVGPRQFPRVHRIAEQCATTLGIATPALYIVNNPYLNGATYGTPDDSFILLHSALVDHTSDEELTTVIGHECGHIHNSHVVYLTALHYLTHMAGAFVKWASIPATLALRAWSRRAEITSDRAGALCVGSLDTAFRTITKLALGSQKLYDELDVDVFLEQNEEGKRRLGRYSEALSTHPWLPKRVLALRAFGESELYRRRARLGDDGLSMLQVDDWVHHIIKIA